MAVADTAKLIASLSLKDGFTGPLKTMDRGLSKFDTHLQRTQGRSFKAGQQIGTGIKNGVVLASAALTGLAGLLLVSAHEGQEAAKVQAVYATAIKNSGKVSDAYVASLDRQQAALLELTGTDDELIKQQQTRLIQMGLTGAQVEKLTPIIFDLAAAGYDLNASTKAVGKAALGSNTALQKMGVIVPKGADAIAELDRRFKGTAASLSGGLDVRLKVLNERLANVRESAGQKLLPALTRIVDVVGAKLVPAFGELIDGLLPTVISGLDKLSGFLSGGGATRAITQFLEIARSAAPVIKSAAETTLTVIQSAVGLFRSLPPEIQALAVAGLAINKLTGGLVTNIAGGLIQAVISSFHGLMNVNAAVVNVNGPGGGLGSLLGTAGGITIGAFSAVAIAALGSAFAFSQTHSGSGSTGSFTPTLGAAFDNKPVDASSLFEGVDWEKVGRQMGIPYVAKKIDQSTQAIKDRDQTAQRQFGSSSPITQAIKDLDQTIGGSTLSVQIEGPVHLSRDELRGIFGASGSARGVKNRKGASTSLQPRLDFLAGDASGGKDAAVARSLTTLFEQSNAPLYRNTANLVTTIRALKADAKTLSGKNAATVGGYINRLKAELKRRKFEVRVQNVVNATTNINGRILQADVQRFTSTVEGNAFSTGG